MTVPGDKMVSIRLTADQWRWVHGVLDGQLDAGACKDGNYEAETKALIAASRQIVRAVKTLRPTNHPSKPPSIVLDVDDLEHIEGMLEDRERG